MWRHLASNALSVMVLALVALAGVVGWAMNGYQSEGPLDTAICLRVESGSNMRVVSQRLEDDGAVASAALFRMGATYTERTDDLKAGSFLVPEKSSMDEITTIVTRGGQSTCGTEVVYRIGVNSASVQVRELDPTTNRFVEEVAFDPAETAPAAYEAVAEQADTRFRVAVAEGVTSWQVVDALSRAGFLTGEVGEVPAEGALAPDSYEVRRASDRSELIGRMLSAQEQRLAAAWEGRSPDLPYDTPEEALIMASIVEKETGVAAERAQVASVFVNRLRQGMRLQTDPTVIYGITNGEGVLGRGLRRSELDAATPYNTYAIDGLPPTPIANPGMEAILATLDPDSTDYLYFVADGTGGHAFARTLDEHNANVRRWREIEASRQDG